MKVSKPSLADLRRLQAEAAAAEAAAAARADTSAFTPHRRRKADAGPKHDTARRHVAHADVETPAPDQATTPTLTSADQALFRHAMRFVQPLPDCGTRARAGARRDPDVQLRARRQHAEGAGHAATGARERTTRRRLAESIQTGFENPLAHFHPEATEFLSPGCGPDLLRGLRRGKWIPQATLDLHGNTLQEAGERLDRFLASCLDHDIRCVRVVHGKGLGSRQGESVLRAAMRLHLSRLEAVQAWVQCAEHEGGAGAVNALLRAPAGAKG